jgi:NADH-quinone oxidoreductase subunit D
MPYTLRPDEGYGVDIDAPTYLDSHLDTGERWVLNFGPQHPATHTTLRLVLELDGERIARCTPHIGYLHSGFEKLGEHLDYNQYVTIVSRMDYLSPIHNDITWHGAVERLFGIEITPRCKVLRTIMNELARIQNHLLCVGAAGLDLGAFTAFLYAFNPREKIYDICDFIAGQRFHPDWTRVGGLMQDLPDEAVFRKMVKAFIHDDLPRAVEDLEKLLLKNRIFLDRTVGIGTLSGAEAIAWSMSGPMARASGVRRDLRKDMPYLCYADNWDGQGAPAVDFKVVVANDPANGRGGGDCFARFHVRVEEIKQSIRIIDQLIDNIPPGPVDAFADSKMVKPPKPDVYGSIEGLIQHFELIMSNRGFTPPVAEVYGWNEGPNGEQGFYIVSDGTARPWRVKTRPACFINYQVMARLTEGHMLSDVVAILGSINVVAAELDR